MSVLPFLVFRSATLSGSQCSGNLQVSTYLKKWKAEAFRYIISQESCVGVELISTLTEAVGRAVTLIAVLPDKHLSEFVGARHAVPLPS